MATNIVLKSDSGPKITLTSKPALKLTLSGGLAGKSGPGNTLTIGTVKTGAPGSAAVATITGASPNQVINLTLPAGSPGGAGAPNQITIGTVTTGATGTAAQATLIGQAPNQTLNLVLPAGPQGVGTINNYNTIKYAQANNTASGLTGLTGAVDGTNKLFVVPDTYYGTGTLAVWQNGVFQLLGDSITQTDPASGKFTFVTAPATGDQLYVTYQLVSSGSGAGGTTTDATATAKGIVQLAGDLGGTAAAPTVPGLATKEPAITAGTTSQYLRGDKTFQTLDKTAVGLANVDNTSDTNKPVSSATQTALNAKQATLISGTNIKTVNGTTLLGSGDIAIAGGSSADATTTSKGSVQLAGDLGGTAASPQVIIGTARDYNLIPNPSFEVDYSSWTNYGVYDTISRDSGTAFSGTYSSKHTNTSASDGGMVSTAFTLNPGNYIFSVYAKLSSDVTNACMVVRGSGATTGVVTQINQSYPGNTNFNRYTGTITVATQGTYEVLLGQGSYGSLSTGSVNYDAVMLTLASANQTYFDGSLTSGSGTTYSWVGTAHNSQSLRTSPSRLINSDNLLEGASNLFFTTDRASKTASSVLAYWDGTVDPTVIGQSYPLATLGGVATYVSGSGVQLTPNTKNQAGQIYWDFVQAPFMRVQYNFMAAPDTGGADATWFYCFANANPTTEYGSGGFTKGYLVYISEFSGRIGLAYGGFNDGTQGQSGNGAANQPLVSVSLPAAQIVNGSFNNVDVTIRYNRITVRYNGTVMIDYTDIYTRDLTNTKFGFGSRTGGSSNNHYIKGLVVAKLGQNLNEYGIQSRVDDTTKTYVDNGLAAKQGVLTLTTNGTSGAATLASGTLNIPNYASGSGTSGITRSVTSGSAAVTLGATTSTDYVYGYTGSANYTVTLPTAASNTNQYTLINASSVAQTLAAASGQTIEGSATATIAIGQRVSLIALSSTAWYII